MKLYITLGKEDAPEGYTKSLPSELGNQLEATAEEIQCVPNLLEKIPDLVSFMGEAYRILTVGGKFIAIAGYYGAANALMSPLIVRAFSEYSMNWCSKEWREANKITEIPTDINFEVGAAVSTAVDLNLRSDEVQALWRATRLNCIQGVHFNLIKK